MLCTMYALLGLKGLKINGTIIDTMISGSLVDENRFRYDLGSMGRDYVGRGKNEAVLLETAKEWGIDPKSEMYKLPAYVCWRVCRARC